MIYFSLEPQGDTCDYQERLDGCWGIVPSDDWKDSGQQGETAGAGKIAGIYRLAA
jgi:hypothetical protein